MANITPSAYRQVSVADVDVPLTEPALVGYFLGRECYRRTRYIVACHGPGHALVEVELSDRTALMSPAIEVTVLGLPGDTVYVRRPDTDTGVPSQLARVALEYPTARCVVVEGRYGHVSCLLEPAPIVIRVMEVVPPFPAKLLDQAQRVLDVAEDLPPIVLAPDLIDLHELAPAAGDILLPCRGSGVEVEGSATWYLDRRPDRHDWVLVGCARSRELHQWFYGDEPPTVETCPNVLARAGHDGALLTKCCLLEDRINISDAASPAHRAVVPWGASLDQIREALTALARAAEPAWAPA